MYKVIGRTGSETYQYDDLHRLTGAEGSYKAQGSVMDDTLHTYENSFSYDTIGNIMQKVQQHEGPNESGDLATMPGTTYTYNYGYNQARPHAVTSINDGSITFRYDASGNMTARYDEEENSWRTLHWDAENRLVKTIDNEVATNYAYDAEGTRVTKSGSSGEVTYVDPAYVIRNNSITGKHVFVGNTRVASKMDVKGDDEVSGVYYYHADHLGSSSVVTGKTGSFHERIEYFPYGETWVEDKAISDGYSSPYRYTAKEYDPETGLYYFGARYYDARLGRWVSVDPILSKYLPTGNKKRDSNLPGMGGVFNSINLNLYHYSGNNPVIYVDPDGNAYLMKHNGSYSYMSSNKAIKMVAAACGAIPFAGEWISKSAVPSVLGLTNLDDVNYNSGNFGMDSLANIDKIDITKSPVISKISKTFSLIGLSFVLKNIVDEYKDNLQIKTEHVIEQTGMVRGKNKEKLMFQAKGLEKLVKKMIENGEIDVSIDNMGNLENLDIDNKDRQKLRGEFHKLETKWYNRQKGNE